ncbi:sugar ABC transporter substrate-binding protein [Microbacterium terricola]|uniref:Sugar ABC transporter substrate-binding protein n=1 Tax=Microbacterium terricola TaxID=344163 RepID=A0ABM8E157_9MICO|nr:sugar ABC transporter substrate-binding protein [Microbacterium terricola]UYK40741.1 sugar ABC transporter substrate-binding protein [Microbacterium terricola]BDV31522.1 sugar ABC transporter substrate-binding protein [Microbacterium terricola]
MNHPTTTRTRWLAGTAALGIGALLLAGCGRSDEPTSPSAEAGAGIDDSPATGEIDVWAMGNEGEVLDELAAQFEDANPDATINVTAVPWDGAHDRIATAIAGGQTPDVTMLGTTWVGEFAPTGAFEPTPEGVVDTSSFFEGSQGTTVVDGVSYGVPWYVDTRVLYYRTDMAEAAGLDAPATWDDLTAFAEGMRAEGAASGLSLPPGGPDSSLYLLPFVWQAGGDVLTEDGSAFAFDTDAWKTAFEYYNSFFTSGLSENVRLETGEIEQKFIAGDVGAFYSGPFHVSLLKDQGGKDFEDKFAVAMVPGDQTRTSFTGGGNLAVFGDTDNRDTAWKFVRWLSQPETQVEWYGISTDLPSVESAFEDPVFADDPYTSVFGEQLSDAKAPPAIPTWAQISAIIDQEIEQVTRGDKSVDDALASIQQQAEAIGTGS